MDVEVLVKITDIWYLSEISPFCLFTENEHIRGSWGQMTLDFHLIINLPNIQNLLFSISIYKDSMLSL